MRSETRVRSERNHTRRSAAAEDAKRSGLECLTAPERAAARLTDARRRLEGKLSRCRRMTAAYGAGTIGRGSGSTGEDALTELADLIEEVRQRQEEVRTERRRLRRLLAGMSASGGKGERNAMLLEQRYLLRRTWPQVREALAEEGFGAGTDRTLFNWHKEALRQLEEMQ